jgi:hypothetical protein
MVLKELVIQKKSRDSKGDLLDLAEYITFDAIDPILQ